MRTADNALARALIPAASRKAGFNKAEPWMEYTTEEGMELERSVSEARDAGNGGHVVYGERMRQGITRLNQLRAAAGDYNHPGSPSIGGGGLGYTPIPSSERQPIGLSHRSPSPQQESPIERTLRKQKLQALKGGR